MNEDWLDTFIDGAVEQVEAEWLPEKAQNQLGLVPEKCDGGHNIPYFLPTAHWKHLPMGGYGPIDVPDVLWSSSEGDVRRPTSLVEVGIGDAGQCPACDDVQVSEEDIFLPTLVERTGFRCSSFLLVGTEDE